MTSTSNLFQLVRRAARLGWTRFGSPGIFGMPTRTTLCSPAYSLAGQDRNATGCRASFEGADRLRTAQTRSAAHGTGRPRSAASAAAQTAVVLTLALAGVLLDDTARDWLAAALAVAGVAGVVHYAWTAVRLWRAEHARNTRGA